MLITNSGKYGITTGSYIAEWIALTDLGKRACDPTGLPRDKLAARFTLSIENIAPFKSLYDEYVGKRLAAHEVMFDFLDSNKELKVSDNAECVDIFVINARDLGLLRVIGGAETLVPIALALDEVGGASPESRDEAGSVIAPKVAESEWDTICFYVTPIGDEGSEERKHSDLFKSSLIEPAMKELGLHVVRADELETSGMITTSILEHIKRSKLVIADLSKSNPNVYYEIGLRHACRLPIVQIRQKSERLPFDVGQVKTITIDNTDLHSFVPHIETFRSEIANVARSALADPAKVSNPITVFYPAFWD
jgi:hypothetical protein